MHSYKCVRACIRACVCILLTYNLPFIMFLGYLHAVVGVYWHRKLVNTIYFNLI
jgi:hypothetical protein